MSFSATLQVIPPRESSYRQNLVKKKLLMISYGMGGFVLLCWGALHYTQLLKCQSDSLPNTSYILVLKGTRFERGDIVYIRDHQVKYVETKKPLAKRVIGLPGDLMERGGEGIRLIPKNTNLSPILLLLLKQTSKGDPLTPLSLFSIPEGYVFVAGDHPKSFDSRYEEFGLVSIENIDGRALWWW